MPPTVKTENKYGLDWVLLNNRWYCVQNYSPTHLTDGTPIPIVTDQTDWNNLTTPARCVYNNSVDAAFIAKYGYLYNWYGVDEGLEMPCAGCVVPDSTEWAELQTWLITNGFNWDGTIEGNKIGKALASSEGEWTADATVGAVGNDQASNNSSGFTGLPGGRRNDVGTFVQFGADCNIWTGTEATAQNGGQLLLRHTNETLAIANITKKRGYSIRISRPRAKMFLPPQLIYQGL